MEWAEAAGITRVDTHRGAELVGGDARKRDHAGLYIPYYLPKGLAEARGSLGQEAGGRLRRDHPELQVTKGGHKPKNKYLSPPGDRNKLYIPPRFTAAHVADAKLPVLIVEGEFKALSAARLAFQDSTVPRFVPIGIAGVWNWQGKIGVTDSPDGTKVDEIGPTPDFSFFGWTGRRVMLAFDADVKTNGQVKAARASLKAYILSLGAEVGMLEWPAEVDGKPAKGLDDWLARDGASVVLEAIAKVAYVDRSHWASRLKTRDNGSPKPILLNAVTAVRHAPEWHDSFQFDTFTSRLEARRRPWPTRDNLWRKRDSGHLACWLQERGIEVGPETADWAAVTAAKEVDSLAEYVRGLRWDGEPRIDNWLIKYMHAETRGDPNEDQERADITEYVCQVGAAWLIGGIARALSPGSQMDYCLVLCGKEGVGKSTALRTLARNWFTDSITDIHGDEPMIKLQGQWLVEFREIAAWKKAEAQDLRGFISSRCDDYRGKYERGVEPHYRRCIFAGTTNDEWFMDPDSENRRYWPIRCVGASDLDGVSEVADQLWAEARARWEDKGLPVLNKTASEIASLVRKGFHQVGDEWKEMVAEYLDRRSADASMYDKPLTMAELLEKAVKGDPGRTGRSSSPRMAKVLRGLGYRPYTYGRRGLSGWRREE